MQNWIKAGLISVACTAGFSAVGCSSHSTQPLATVNTATSLESQAINPEIWPRLEPIPLNPETESRITELMAKMSVEQKVGQVIQADSASVTPQDVRDYRLGSVLSGGNSAPGPLPYADADTWLEATDAYFEASLDDEGVEVAIPVLIGIDAVHGHTNLFGGIAFPHNIGLGAARNPDLIEKIMEATALELRVSGHDWTFAPTLAVPRDDRWGRTYEGFSENPALVASYADRIVFGLQGRSDTEEFMTPDRVLSAAKHFLADGGTDEGKDQGDSSISEEELRDIHNAGYIPALAADVQTVMVSFSAWQGIKMTGNKALITDVLKDRMGFNGFVISDWNAHGQIPGCSNLECPEAFNAGIDMFMAPDSWKGIYDSTLTAVNSGEISMERLDDAVRRILRVKIRAGLFDAVKPSQRKYAGDETILGSASHRSLARQAVRESLVLLKNNDQTLPIDPSFTVLVVGDGADSIAKVSGGWTLSWQGKGHSNDEFPNGQSILSAIQEAVSLAEGTVIFSESGEADIAADVVVAVYGEDPYAEFQGDRDHLDFQTDSFETSLLDAYKAKGMPVVSIFLSGRPMWTNPEINASDAFIAAWLPGSEGGGVADMLFRTDPEYEFTGRLPFSWPKTAMQATVNVGDSDYDPQFQFGYGLGYDDVIEVSELSEASGLSDSAQSNSDTFFAAGRPVAPWSLLAIVDDTQTRIGVMPWNGETLIVSGTDHQAQEDALRAQWSEGGPSLRISAFNSVDISRQTNGAMELAFFMRNFSDEPVQVEIGMGCGDSGSCSAFMPVSLESGSEWQDQRLALSCFARDGVDMTSIGDAFIIRSGAAADIGLASIRLDSDTDATATCGD